MAGTDLKATDYDVSVRKATNRPMVVAHHDGHEGSLHVRFDGYYDVQPINPLNLWKTTISIPTSRR